MFGVVVFAVATALGGAVIKTVTYVQKADREEHETTWQAAADQLGIYFRQGRKLRDSELSGSVRGVDVRVTGTRTRTADGEAVFTHYIVSFPAPPGATSFELSPKEKDPLSFIAERFGPPQDKPSLFHQHVTMLTSDPETTARFLTSTRRDTVVNFFQRTVFVRPRITHTEVVANTRGLENNAKRLFTHVMDLVDVAAVFSGPSEPTDPIRDPYE